jgi:surface antigen
LRSHTPASGAPSPLYRAHRGAGLSPIRGVATAAAIVALGLAAGGCSFRLGSVFDTKKAEAADITGSISAPIVRVGDDTNLTDRDLALARNAASDVLTRGGKDVSQPWENPETGARGSVTPLATAYSDDGKTCRDFLASYVRGTNEGWLQGKACQSVRGPWEIRDMKPWKRS